MNATTATVARRKVDAARLIGTDLILSRSEVAAIAETCDRYDRLRALVIQVGLDAEIGSDAVAIRHALSAGLAEIEG